MRSSGAVNVRIGLRISPPEFNVYPPGESNSISHELGKFVNTSNSTSIDLVESPLCTIWREIGVVCSGAMYSVDLSCR